MVCVQARMGSERLPGKVLMKIGALTCLEHVMARVQLMGFKYVLTIPEGEEDNVLYSYCLDHEWPVQRGPHPDVLLAMANACAAVGAADWIIRITADCPFIQSAIIKHTALNIIKSTKPPFYYSNAHPVRLVPKGLDFEIFDWDLLQQAVTETIDSHDRHHVTPWMRRHFGLKTSTDDGEFRVTLDTEADLQQLRAIAGMMNLTPPNPSLMNLRAFFQRKSNWAAPTKTSSSSGSTP